MTEPFGALPRNCLFMRHKTFIRVLSEIECFIFVNRKSSSPKQSSVRSRLFSSFLGATSVLPSSVVYALSIGINHSLLGMDSIKCCLSSWGTRPQTRKKRLFGRAHSRESLPVTNWSDLRGFSLRASEPQSQSLSEGSVLNFSRIVRDLTRSSPNFAVAEALTDGRRRLAKIV
jgi:hypothetical protein